jgi:hypothetical protein
MPELTELGILSSLLDPRKKETVNKPFINKSSLVVGMPGPHDDCHGARLRATVFDLSLFKQH